MSKVIFRIAVSFMAAVSVFASIAVTTPNWVTGDAASHAFGAGSVRWVQVIALGPVGASPGNSATVQVGDCPATATHGFPIAPGGGYMFPTQVNKPDASYDLSALCYFAATGDKLSIGYAK